MREMNVYEIGTKIESANDMNEESDEEECTEEFFMPIASSIVFNPAECVTFKVDTAREGASSSFTLTNVSAHNYILFNIKTIKPQWYTITPSKGVLEPNASIKIVVDIQPLLHNELIRQYYENPTTLQDRLLIISSNRTNAIWPLTSTPDYTAREKDDTFRHAWKMIDPALIVSKEMKLHFLMNIQSSNTTSTRSIKHVQINTKRNSTSMDSVLPIVCKRSGLSLAITPSHSLTFQLSKTSGSDTFVRIQNLLPDKYLAFNIYIERALKCEIQPKYGIIGAKGSGTIRVQLSSRTSRELIEKLKTNADGLEYRVLLQCIAIDEEMFQFVSGLKNQSDIDRYLSDWWGQLETAKTFAQKFVTKFAQNTLLSDASEISFMTSKSKMSTSSKSLAKQQLLSERSKNYHLIYEPIESNTISTNLKSPQQLTSSRSDSVRSNSDAHSYKNQVRTKINHVLSPSRSATVQTPSPIVRSPPGPQNTPILTPPPLTSVGEISPTVPSPVQLPSTPPVNHGIANANTFNDRLDTSSDASFATALTKTPSLSNASEEFLKQQRSLNQHLLGAKAVKTAETVSASKSNEQRDQRNQREKREALLKPIVPSPPTIENAPPKREKDSTTVTTPSPIVRRKSVREVQVNTTSSMKTIVSTIKACLQLSTQSIHFQMDVGNVPSAFVTLKNCSDGIIAYKIKTTQATRYVVRPHQGFISQQQDVHIEIRLHPSAQNVLMAMSNHELHHIQDSLLVESVPIPNNDKKNEVNVQDMELEAISKVFKLMWSTIDKRNLYACKILVSFVFDDSKYQSFASHYIRNISEYNGRSIASKPHELERFESMDFDPNVSNKSPEEKETSSRHRVLSFADSLQHSMHQVTTETA